MICMHEETFDMYLSDQCTIPNGYILIDDLIAPAIQVLNRKGYITEWSCSGHPLEECFFIAGEFGKYEKSTAPLNSYISFKEGISLPSLPNGFSNDSSLSKRLVIRKYYTVNDFFEVSLNILETMKQLHKWALGLPDFKDNSKSIFFSNNIEHKLIKSALTKIKRRKIHMKFGTTAWSWTPTPEDMPIGNSLETIADKASKLGFEIIDYLSTYESLDTFFTQEKCKEIRKHVENLGMNIGGFVFQSNLWNNPNAEVNAKQFEMLEKCLTAASELGANTVSCIIPSPFGAKPNRRPSPSDKVASNLPADYSWEKDWNLFASNMKKAAQTAKKYGIRIAMECFTKSLCSTPDAMLNLIKCVDEDNFGIQLDTAHLMNQNIDIETAIFMLGGKNIFNVHAKDSDGLTRGNLAPGTGLIDYVAVLRALKNVNYTGNVSVEVEFTTNPELYMAQGLLHVRHCEGIM